MYIPGPLSLPIDVRPVGGRVLSLPSPVTGPGPSSASWHPGLIGGGANIGFLFVRLGVVCLLLSLSLSLLGNIGTRPGRVLGGTSGVPGSLLSALGGVLSALGVDLVLPVQHGDCFLDGGAGLSGLESVKQEG